MKTIAFDRRLDKEQFRRLDHALELVRSHGWRFAVRYAHNQHILDSATQRVLFGVREYRRAKAR